MLTKNENNVVKCPFDMLTIIWNNKASVHPLANFEGIVRTQHQHKISGKQ